MLPEARALMALARAKALDTERATEAAVLASLTVWFGSKEAIDAKDLPDRLVRMLTDLGIHRQAAAEMGNLATVRALTGRTSSGSPQPADDTTLVRRVASEEPGMRARYVLASSRRLSRAIDNNRYDHALDVEQTYLKAHIAAGRNRRAAARRVDDCGKDRVLVWRTQQDTQVESRCALLEGRLFTATHLPDGQIPGAVHPRCRCYPETYGLGPLMHWGTV